MKVKKGIFVTFEGCEGVGKTTQVRMLKEYLEQTNQESLFLREPGGTSISEKIREIILDKNNDKMSNECETFLYCSARSQLVAEVIKPALEEGKLVICDRFIDSTFAYQGVARGLGAEYVDTLNKLACNGVMPDLTIFLNLHPTEAFLRKGGADAEDRLEMAGMAFHEKVYEGYKLAEKMYKDRFVSIDVSGTKQQTQEKIRNCLKERGIIK